MNIGTKLGEVKNFVKNSFRGAVEPITPPTVEQLAKFSKLGRRVPNERRSSYMSSNILNAYNKFKKIQKKHEIEKITKFKVEVAKKSNIEIKDASNFRSTVNNRDSSMPKTLLMGTVPVYNIIGSSKHELNKIRPVSALP